MTDTAKPRREKACDTCEDEYDEAVLRMRLTLGIAALYPLEAVTNELGIDRD